jgi:cation:H+ antiporter
VSTLPVAALVAIFLFAAAAVWVAGIHLSDSTDVLSTRLGFGEALGGLILLAVATNLPEIAITASASLSHNLGIAIGNILGGIAIQTVVLVVLDFFGTRGSPPLSYLGASLQLVLEAVLVVAILVVAIMGTRLPSSLIVWRVAPAGFVILILWVTGLRLLGRAGRGLPWHGDGHAPDSQAEPHGISKQKKEEETTRKGHSTARTVAVFGIAALVTLAGGVALEESGSALSDHIGLSGVLFGSTILAAATALPEVSTGLASVKLGDYKLAFSDIFGGNAFLPVLFVLASLLSGSAVLPSAQDTDVYLAALGILLTAVYACGLIFRPQRRIARMGLDSFVVLVLYVVGIAGLIAVAGK